MSSTKCHRIGISSDHIDVFTFGKNCFYGYDSIDHYLRRYSLINSNEIQEDDLHFSSSPSWPIRRLILNEDETILALIGDSVGYLVSLPRANQGEIIRKRRNSWRILFRKSFVFDQSNTEYRWIIIDINH